MADALYEIVLNHKVVYKTLASCADNAKKLGRSHLICIGWNKHFLAGLTVRKV